MRSMILATSVAAVIGFSLSPAARAVDPPDLFLEHLDDFIWIGGGDGTTWQSAPNWDPPDGYGAEFPNDPGRIDSAEQTLVPVEGANFSSGLLNDLTINISGSDVTVASVKLGGTGAAVTTDITSSTDHLLVFENQESNDMITNPGDENVEPEIEPEPIWTFNQGRALIWSTGTAASEEVNRITARLKPNDDIDVEGDRDLHIYGDILEGDQLTASAEAGRPTSISSLLSNNAVLHIHSNIRTVEADDVPDDPQNPPTLGVQERRFGLNVNHGVLLPEDPQNPPNEDEEVSRSGKIDVHGRLLGAGDLVIGVPIDGGTLPVGTVILRSDSRDDTNNPNDEFYSGRIYISRGNLVLGHDGSLGSGDITGGDYNGPVFGTNFISTSDARKISNEINMSQWYTVAGATDVPGLEDFGDHSIEFSGAVEQTNTRGWMNLLPAGKTLTLSGPQYAIQGGDNADENRIYTMDGTGQTLITGGIHNRPVGAINPGYGHFRKRGTGTVVINYDETNVNDTHSDYSGYTWVQAGNLHYGTNDDLPNPALIDGHTTKFVSTGGAVGVDAGVVGNSTFLALLNNVNNPAQPFSPPTFFRWLDLDAILQNYDSGGLMLAAGEYGQNLDFETAGDLTRAASMTLAAHEGGSTYSGTITPNLGLVFNANTYQLGGGAGTLTLPGTGAVGGPYSPNQLTGGRNLLATNGGEVHLSGTNNYTGTTRVVGKFDLSNREDAAASVPGVADDPSEIFHEGDLFRRTTLTVTTLANGGSPSSIGSSASDASSLLIQNSTFKYVGAAVTTDRLFTVGTGGATIDASGTGALVFGNTGALGMDLAENRTAIVSTNASPTSLNNEVFGHPTFVSGTLGQAVFSTEDLVPGMAIRDIAGGTQQLDTDLMITQVSGDHAVTVGEAVLDEGETAWGGVTSSGAVRTFAFGGVARTMTLSGSNTGNNTLAPLITNAPAAVLAGDNTVNLAKEGNGKWILTGNNTYSGTTTVNAGTLLVNGGHTGAGLTTVNSGGTLGGTGSLAGGVTVAEGGHLAPGASIGTFGIGGMLTLETGSILDFELGAPSTGDLINAALLTINGGTLNLTNSGGLGVGTYTLIDYAGTLTGDEDNLVLGTVPAGFTYDLNDTGSVIQLIVSSEAGVEGDINGDGLVNILDYVVGRMADPAGTGPDLIDWRENYDGGLSGSGANSAVPEPATWLLLTLALIASSCTRRRG